MRIESSVTSVSWIPSEAISGVLRLPMDLGIGRYDPPPPAVIDDLEELRRTDRFRFANELRAWVDVGRDGRVTDAGYAGGGGHIGGTTIDVGVASFTVAAVAFPTIRSRPEVGDGWVRFVQTAGGRTGAPVPRRIDRPPFVRITSPTAWTTLSLTVHTDAEARFELLGASGFPRHWIYDQDGRLVRKSGTTDFSSWTRLEHDRDTPWGGTDSRALVTEAETALERELSATIMGGRRPRIRALPAGEALTLQGEAGEELYLLLDGVLSVEVNGRIVAEVGPGAVVGERALLEGGRRTATLRALTPTKVAVAMRGTVDRQVLAPLAGGHRREEPR